MDALDSYDLHNTDDYDDDFSSDDFNEDAYAYDLLGVFRKPSRSLYSCN